MLCRHTVLYLPLLFYILMFSYISKQKKSCVSYILELKSPTSCTQWWSKCVNSDGNPTFFYYFFFFIVFFTSYFVFSIAVLPHSPGVVYYHLLLRRETRIPGVAPFSLQIGIWDLFVHRGQKSYTPTAFGKLWTTPGVRCMKHASS